MTWWLPYNFDKKRPYLEARMALVKATRQFFDDQGFHEVQTPVLQYTPVMDAHIHGFQTQLLDHDLKHKQTRYLQTSPEFDMKKLMVAGLDKLFQICPVFRNAEGGTLHSPEFTMLEWYRTGVDYTALMDDCEALLKNIAKKLEIAVFKYKGKISDPFKAWQKITVSDAFKEFAGINLEEFLDDRDGFYAAVKMQGIRVSEDDCWDDLFFRVMGEKIEPNLGVDVPCILYEYPACMASLSRCKPDDPRWAERFELYICGIELANAFSELTNAPEQRKRFESEMDLKEKLYGYRYPIDEDFFKALEHGLPESAGIALGLDRLVMLATGASDISEVLWAG